MRTAKAAVYEAPNTPFVLKEFPLRAVKRGEVLVRVTMSTICRSDIHSYEGRRPNPCPGILGHEIIGIVEEIGEGIDKDMRSEALTIGDRRRRRSRPRDRAADRTRGTHPPCRAPVRRPAACH